MLAFMITYIVQVSVNEFMNDLIASGYYSTCILTL